MDEDGAGEGLKTAQGIVKRLRDRNLYKFINEIVVPHKEMRSWKVGVWCVCGGGMLVVGWD